MKLWRYRYVGTRHVFMCSLAAILLVVSMLPRALPVYASSWTELKGTIYADETSVQADGTSVAHVQLVLRDQDGRAVDLPPDQIRLQASLGTWTAAPAAVGNGAYTALLTAPTTAGISYISAEAAGVMVTDMARVYFAPGVPSPERSVLTASRQALPADGSSQTIISLQLKDAFGNDIAEPADALQLFTTGGQLGTVTHVTYGRYEASIVSAVYGRLGSLTNAAGSLLDPQADWEAGAIPPGTPNGAPLPVSLSFSYESYGTYQAVLTAANEEGTAKVSASLNGVTVTSNVYVAFSRSVAAIEPVALSFGQASYGMNVGQQVQAGLSARWSDQSVSDVTAFAAFRVADASIAAVDNGGIVRGLKAGQTVLTATYGNLTQETVIRVNTPVVDPETPSTPGGTVPSTPGAPSAPSSAIQVEIVPVKGAASSKPITLEAIRQGAMVLDLQAGGGEVRLSGASLREIGKVNPQAVLVLQAGGASMSVPISELSAQAYSQTFKIPENDIQFHFIVRAPEEAVTAAVKQAVSDMAAEQLAPAMAFEVQVTGSSGASAFISKFNRYVTRTLPISGDSVPTTATGVWWVPGTKEFHYVPTTFDNQNDQWTALMKRQGASVYTVINKPVTFSDVQNHWGKAPIELLAAKLIIQGRSPGVYAPDAPITRAEVAALLVRALGLTPSDAKSPFTDIAGGWYEQAVNTAYQADLVAGYEDATFRPDRPVTREELVQMVVGAMAFAEVKPEKQVARAAMIDQEAVSVWAQQAVKQAAETGVIDSGGAFRPASESTRAETASMLERMLKLVQFIQ